MSRISTLSRFLLAIPFFVGAIAPTPAAQAPIGVIADVPFEFSVNNKQLAPGTYRIQLTSNRDLVLRNIVTGRSQYLATYPVSGNDIVSNGRLTFHRYEGHNYLSQVSIPGRSVYTLLPSRSERHMMLVTQAPASAINMEVALKTPTR
jgi:hypothetical protein